MFLPAFGAGVRLAAVGAVGCRALSACLLCLLWLAGGRCGCVWLVAACCAAGAAVGVLRFGGVVARLAGAFGCWLAVGCVLPAVLAVLPAGCGAAVVLSGAAVVLLPAGWLAVAFSLSKDLYFSFSFLEFTFYIF